MTVDTLFISIFAAVILLVALGVVLRNYRKPANIAFGATCVCLVIWAVLNYESTTASESTTLATVRLTGLFGALLIASFYALSTVFPNNLSLKPLTRQTVAVLTAAIAVLSQTPLLIADGMHTPTGLKLTEGPLYPLYALFVTVLFIMCNVNFVRQYKRASRTGKSQIRFMWLGIFTTVLLIIASNIIVPALADNWSSSKWGTLFCLPFVGFTAYAIAARRMFDTRLVVVRTLAYVTTIGILGAAYSFIVILLTTNFISIDQLTSKQLLTLVLPALFIALTFHRLQLALDKLTKRLFYRDAYDIREVLDVLSNTLIEERDIDTMMRRSLGVLADALKPTTACLAVVNESGVVYKQVSIGSDITPDLTVLIHRLGLENRALIDSNEPNSQGMSRAMLTYNTELLLRLGNKQAPVGVLILGAKRNGSMYSLQDVAVLEIAAKNMSIALDNAKKYEQIMHFTETLHKEVQHATSRLRNANKKLKGLDALKDDFIATASHQLRSPAVSVHDALQMLNYPGVTEQDRKEMLEMAESSSERLVTVVRTMLNMARIQAGHFTIDRSEADIIELVNKELIQVGVVARQKNITLNFKPAPAPIMAHVDIAKIKEAMANYIENAVKYSAVGATIDINLKLEDNLIRFEVADRGMGVPEQERDKLFGRFYRASNARVEEPDGNGIGLYVVKMIAEGHNGEAYFRPNDGGGSVFGLTIKQS